MPYETPLPDAPNALLHLGATLAADPATTPEALARRVAWLRELAAREQVQAMLERLRREWPADLRALTLGVNGTALGLFRIEFQPARPPADPAWEDPQRRTLAIKNWVNEVFRGAASSTETWEVLQDTVHAVQILGPAHVPSVYEARATAHEQALVAGQDLDQALPPAAPAKSPSPRL